MNFYTSNSKLKTNIIITFVFILLFITITHFLLNVLVSLKTDKNHYVMNIASKTKHMYLNANKNTEIIFIGNSRTLYHISTEVFKKHNIGIYNYGVSDRTIYNYTNMTENALKCNPKTIIINIKIDDIFMHSNYLNHVSIEDITAMIQTNQDIDLIKKALLDYFNNFYELVNYSEIINEKIQGFYRQFTPKIPSIIKNKTYDKPNKITINNTDCNIFDTKYPLNNITTKCTNGDGILFGNKLNNKQTSQNFMKIDIKYINLLNYIITKIQQQHIRPIVIFEPIYKNKYTYNLKSIQNSIHTDIIDLTNMHIPSIMWVDNNHLNNKGRIYYSDFLTKKLTKEIK